MLDSGFYGLLNVKCRRTEDVGKKEVRSGVISRHRGRKSERRPEIKTNNPVRIRTRHEINETSHDFNIKEILIEIKLEHA
jgi:hypothetical protein